MRKGLIFTLVFLFVTIYKNDVISQSNKISGKWVTSGYYGGVVLNLKPDSSFTFKYKGHNSSDTTAGHYYLSRDTVYLKYEHNNYDLIFAGYEARNEEIPLHLKVAASRVILRPNKLLVRGKTLLVLDNKTGRVKTYKERGKTTAIILRPAK